MEIDDSEFESCRKAVMADCSKKTHNWVHNFKKYRFNKQKSKVAAASALEKIGAGAWLVALLPVDIGIGVVIYAFCLGTICFGLEFFYGEFIGAKNDSWYVLSRNRSGSNRLLRTLLCLP